jgi:hypothetical protein
MAFPDEGQSINSAPRGQSGRPCQTAFDDLRPSIADARSEEALNWSASAQIERKLMRTNVRLTLLTKQDRDEWAKRLLMQLE